MSDICLSYIYIQVKQILLTNYCLKNILLMILNIYKLRETISINIDVNLVFTSILIDWY